MAIDTTSTLFKLNAIATELGLDNWQIQEAKYNGVTFHAVQNIFDRLSQDFNPANGIIDSTKKTLGISDADIPYGTNIKIMQGVDKWTRKAVITELPNNRDNIQDLGYNGNTFEMVGLLWGLGENITAYQLASMFLADDEVFENGLSLGSASQYHVLHHPFYGEIPDCWLMEMEIARVSMKWRAASFRLVFRTENPIYAPTNGRTSLLNNLNNTISGILSTASILNNTWNFSKAATAQLFANNITLKGLTNNIFVTNLLQEAQAGINLSINNIVATTQLLTTNLAPVMYNNVQLNNTVSTPNSLPRLLYFVNHTSPNDINNINDFLAGNINATIASIDKLNTNQYNDTINNLKGMLAQVGKLSLLLLNSYFGQLKAVPVPYDISLYELCILNNIDYQSNYIKIIQLNKDKTFYLNCIRKGTLVKLPISESFN